MMDQDPVSSQKAAVKKVQEDQQSQWSLDSIEQLKGLNLKQLQQQQDRQQHPMHKQKQQKQSKPKLAALYPPAQEITSQSKLHDVGKIICKVGQLLIVQANACINLVDFDNWLFNANRECVGFVIDIFGRVDHPYYAVKMLEDVEKRVANWQEAVGVSLYYAQGCRTLTQDDIKSIKQKSSIYKEGEVDNDSSSSEEIQHIQNQSDDQMRSNQIMRKRQVQPPRRKASYEQQPINYRERTREKKHHHSNHSNVHHPHYNAHNNPHHRDRHQYQDPRRRHHNAYDDRQNAQMRDRHNQAYLQSMYNMYYNQMMQLYNGQNGMPLPRPPVNFNTLNTNMPPIPMNMSIPSMMPSNMQPMSNTHMSQMPPMPGSMPPMPTTVFPAFQAPHPNPHPQ